MVTLVLSVDETVEEVSKVIDLSKIDVVIKIEGRNTEILKGPFKKLDI